MPRIFISYRRDDTEMAAGRLASDLRARFGDGVVFRDKESIPLGADWMNEINRAIGPGGVVLLLIGDKWLEGKPRGERRLDDPNDPHRNEISAALRLNAPVLPLLVGHAKMPSRDELPNELQRLPALNAMKLRDEEWVEFDFPRLARSLEAAGFKPIAGPPTPESTLRFSGKVGTAMVLIGLVLAGYMGELDHEGLQGGLFLALLGMVLAVLGLRDIHAHRVRGALPGGLSLALGAVASVLMAIGLIDYSGHDNMPEQWQAGVDFADSDTPPDNDPVADSRPPPVQPAPQQFAAVAPPVQVAPPANISVRPDPPRPPSLSGMWVDQGDGSQIQMWHEGVSLSATVNSGGMVLGGVGTVVGSKVEIVWGVGGVPIATSSLSLSANGRELSGQSTTFEGASDWTVLRRQ